MKRKFDCEEDFRSKMLDTLMIIKQEIDRFDKSAYFLVDFPAMEDVFSIFQTDQSNRMLVFISD
jgi:hypothetical protein